METLKIKANAKINLSLSVLGKRSDGYHELDTIMQSVSLFDDIWIKKSDKISVQCGGIAGDNIAQKAAELFFTATKLKHGAEIKIEKHIPSSAGLGGGSSDAAAVLVGLDRLFETHLSYDELLLLAVKLGADVPFLISGGTARAGGIGEKLTPLKKIPDCTFIIAKSGQKPSTAEMYARLDKAVYEKPNIQKSIEKIENSDLSELCNTLKNSFSVLWDGSELTEMLKATGALTVALSGSGPAYFAVYSDKSIAIKAEKILKEKNIECYLCSPTDKSVYFE